jgi:hypothetical protein
MDSILSAWQTFSFQTAIIVFFAYILVDGMYAYYTVEITKRKPYSSATVGSAIHIVVAFGVLNYVQNFLYIIPLVIGSWIGTFIMVKKEQNGHKIIPHTK